jgi:hypothetical protein
MAIDYEDYTKTPEFSGRVDTALDDAGYPFGSPKSDPVTGTPYISKRGKDFVGFQQAALVAAGMTPSGDPDTAQVSQVYNALSSLFATVPQPTISNGNCEVWQEATTQTASGYGSQDMVFAEHAGTVTKTVNRVYLSSADVDQSTGLRYANETTFTAGDVNSHGSTELRFLDIRKYSGRKISVNGFLKVDTAKNIGVVVSFNYGTGGAPSPTVSVMGIVNVANTTTHGRENISFDVPVLSGTYGTDNNSYASISYVMTAGAGVTTLPAIGNQSGTFSWTGIQLDFGAVSLPYRMQGIADTLAACLHHLVLIESFLFTVYIGQVNHSKSVHYRLNPMYKDPSSSFSLTIQNPSTAIAPPMETITTPTSITIRNTATIPATCEVTSIIVIRAQI